jgi:hypothetical protein
MIPSLEVGAVLLDEPSELLYRQVNPSWIHAGRVSSQAFVPTSKDGGLLSVDRSSITSAKDSWQRFVNSGYSSQGVWGVTVAEVTAVGLHARSDPNPDGQTNPAHAVVDFRDLGGKPTKKAAQALAANANYRGCLHPPG